MRIGPSLDYVGGDVAMSKIERDKVSLQEVKGFLQIMYLLNRAWSSTFLCLSENW